MRRFVICVLAVLAALLLQLTLVDRLPLGSGAPDLVLLVVTALGLTGGPAVGMLTGFWAGLALDIAPPASQLVGGRALVFCLVGYGCGQLRGIAGRSALSSLGMAAAAVSAGEVLYVVAGLILGSPGITWAAIRLALPSTVLMDIMISPFVMYLVERACHAPWPVLGGSPATAGLPSRRPGRLLRRAGSCRAGSLRGGSLRGGGSSWPGPPGTGPLPRLRPGAGQAGSAAGGRPPLPLPPRPVRLRAGALKRGGAPRATALRAPGASPGRLKVPVRAQPRLHGFRRPDGFRRSGSGQGGGLR
jgi:rod shape-determining protein MreD